MSRLISFIRYLGSNFFFPLTWTLIIIFLLCLPGRAIPGMGIFGIKHLDKLVHIFLFGSFVTLWAVYVWKGSKSWQNWVIKLSLITAVSILIGIVMEYVQEAYVPNRSFDVWDIWADAVGSLLIMYVLWKYGKRLDLLRE